MVRENDLIDVTNKSVGGLRIRSLLERSTNYLVFSGMDIYRFANGKIYDHRIIWDAIRATFRYRSMSIRRKNSVLTAVVLVLFGIPSALSELESEMEGILAISGASTLKSSRPPAICRS